MHAVTPLCVGHVNDTPVQQAQEVDSHFSVGDAIVLLRDNWTVEDNFTSDEVKLVILDVEQSLRFVPGYHALSVSTKSGDVKGAGLRDA